MRDGSEGTEGWEAPGVGPGGVGSPWVSAPPVGDLSSATQVETPLTCSQVQPEPKGRCERAPESTNIRRPRTEGRRTARRYRAMRRSRRSATSLAIGGAILAISLAAPAASFADGPLAGWWPMNEGNGQTVYDWSGNGNHGTLGSTPDVDANDPTWTEGIFGAGRALAFNDEDIVTIAARSVARAQAPDRVELGARAAVAREVPLHRRQGEPAVRGRLVRAVHRARRRPGVLRVRRHAVPRVARGAAERLEQHAGTTPPGRSTARRCGSTSTGARSAPARPSRPGPRSRTRSPRARAGSAATPTACALTLEGDVDTVRIWNQALPIELYWAIARSLFNR